MAFGQPVHLCLLGHFVLRASERLVELPVCSQRVVAYLALHGRAAGRRAAAGTLWPERAEHRAAGNLRSALWRLSGAAPGLVERHAEVLALANGVTIDIEGVTEQARRLLEHKSLREHISVDLLRQELLTNWFDDWVIVERERHNQLRARALERVSACLSAGERHAEAIEAGLAAVEAEPFRESAHLAVMRAFVAEGNVAAALRHHGRLKELLRRELNTGPGTEVERFLATVTNP